MPRPGATARAQPPTHQLLGPHVVQDPLGVLTVVPALHDGQEQLGSIVLIREAEGGRNGGSRMGGGLHARAHDTVLRPGQTDISPHGRACPGRTMRHFRPRNTSAGSVWVLEVYSHLGTVSPQCFLVPVLAETGNLTWVLWVRGPPMVTVVRENLLSRPRTPPGVGHG